MLLPLLMNLQWMLGRERGGDMPVYRGKRHWEKEAESRSGRIKLLREAFDELEEPKQAIVAKEIAGTTVMHFAQIAESVARFERAIRIIHAADDDEDDIEAILSVM